MMPGSIARFVPRVPRAIPAALAVVVVSAFMVISSAFALVPELEVFYYLGCGSTTLNGDAFRTCNGQWTYNGQQFGHWKSVSSYNCLTEQSSATYYEWCDGGWSPVGASEFLGSCSCNKTAIDYYENCGSQNRVGGYENYCNGTSEVTWGTTSNVYRKEVIDCDTGTTISLEYFQFGGQVPDNNYCYG